MMLAQSCKYLSSFHLRERLGTPARLGAANVRRPGMNDGLLCFLLGDRRDVCTSL